jgi:hypothetical protein
MEGQRRGAKGCWPPPPKKKIYTMLWQSDLCNGIVSACHRRDWRYESWDRIPQCIMWFVV